MNLKNKLENNLLFALAFVIGLIPTIQLCRLIANTPSNSSGNPFFLYTFLVLFLPAIPLGIGFAISERMKKNK